jgi:hypothetical protein
MAKGIGDHNALAAKQGVFGVSKFLDIGAVT